eukprot:m.315919 g.315919  ORF g.315919 m.315919 type:complete len:556 (+) comp27535_c0_seq1:52-1719(+)
MVTNTLAANPAYSATDDVPAANPRTVPPTGGTALEREESCAGFEVSGSAETTVVGGGEGAAVQVPSTPSTDRGVAAGAAPTPAMDEASAEHGNHPTTVPATDTTTTTTQQTSGGRNGSSLTRTASGSRPSRGSVGRRSTSRARFGSAALNRAHSRPPSVVIASADQERRPVHMHRLFRPIIAIVVYFLCGLIFYTQYEGWTFVDALYFCIVVVTTIGYGDNNPIETDGGKLFTAAFALLGVSVVFGSLSIVLDVIQEKSKQLAAQAAKSAVAKSFAAPAARLKTQHPEGYPEQTSINVEETDTDAAHLPIADTPHTAAPAGKQGFIARCVNRVLQYYRRTPFLRTLVWMIFIMGIGIVFVVSHPRVESNDDDGSPTEDRYTFVEGLYWVCITGTTVGFGDFSPETQDARLFAIFYLIFLVTATGGFLGEVGRHMDADRGSKRDEVLNRGLSVALIAELDEDGDGEVTRIEWLKGMLVALDEADGELIDIILQQFDNLDVDKSGSLDMEDIRAATEQAAAGIDVDSSPEESFADRVNAHVDGRDDKHNMKIGVHRI